MRIPQPLTVCIAALRTPIWPSPAPARAAQSIRRGKTPSTLVKTAIRTGAMAAAIVLACLNFAAAQESASSPDPNGNGGVEGAPCRQCDALTPAIFVANPNPIMGFENPADWSVQVKGKTRLSASSTSVRTEGSAALEVAKPPSEITLTSVPVNSQTKALAGIGKSGAILQLDFRLEPQSKSLIQVAEPNGEPANEGSIEAFVSVKSLGLSNVPLGKATFQNFRSGIYNTIGFAVPESLSSALEGHSFNDLVFEFAIDLPNANAGSYLLDNLRVHSVEVASSPSGSAPPAGYGNSLELSVSGPKAVTGTFALSPAQIPSGFHLTQGTTGATTVQLALGLDANAGLTCLYSPDSGDKSAQSYILKSCTNGYLAGDLVTSNWVSLGILRGNSSQQLQAQLSLNPVGGQSGAGIIPPMPTFWGSSENCTPAPVAGKVVTASATCASQTAQANQIVTNYFNLVNSAHPSNDWVVAPVPDAALRSSDGSPFKFAVHPEIAANDIPFQSGGDLNPGGNFDAYWQLSGNLTPTAVAGTDENLTHFDASFTAHSVLFGNDVDVVDAKVTADTDSGATTPSYKPAKSSGTLGFYVFGEEIPSGGLTFHPSTGFSVDPSWTQELNLPPIQIWIFDITLGATVEADLSAEGSAALSGADLSVTPTAALGGHIKGGINLGIASGDVDAKVNFVTLSVPTTAQVKWVLNTDPSICSATLNGSLNSDLKLSSGGGEVDLDATFGFSPFSYTDSYTLVKWNPLVSKSWTLFDETVDTQLFGLPSSMCKYPITVKIASPTSGASLSSGLPTVLTGSASPNETTLPYTSTYNWTYTPGANAGTVSVNPAGANSANPTVTFGPPTSGNTSTWTIGLTATTTVRSAGGVTLTQTATATPVTDTVTRIPAGVYIGTVSSSTNGVAVPDPVTGVLNVGNVPGIITVSGVVSGGSGALNTAYTVVPCNDQTAACTSPGAPIGLTVSGAATAAPTGTWTSGFSGGYYKITMTTTAGGAPFGTASVVIFGMVLI